MIEDRYYSKNEVKNVVAVLRFYQQRNEKIFEKRHGTKLPCFQLLQDLLDSITGSFAAIDELSKRNSFANKKATLYLYRSIQKVLQECFQNADKTWDQYTTHIALTLLQDEEPLTNDIVNPFLNASLPQRPKQQASLKIKAAAKTEREPALV